jgi:gluconolactonase
VFLLLAGTSPAAEEKDKRLTRKVRVKDLHLTIPANWTQQRPANRLRNAQFSIPPRGKDKKPVEMYISFFGGSGGGIAQNVKRWQDQFQSKDRRVKVTEGESPMGSYLFVELSGTFNKPIGPPIRRKTESMPGARMLGVILTIKDRGNYFLKMTGPQATVAAEAKTLRAAFGGNTETEEPWKPEAE